ncbi:hypothetical protein GCM10011344_42040 [Dokdonia pacifica]|uniref:Lipoprotein n=1 Tax=Dokdonia pacifica TaxID=1627892 RepID=A0A239DJG4_9FLAO|nr:hypothetical protein [Dokdonia pacifica]GGG36795.1 hypothetical protein GCM10011344_42040 [Dokdonia pacifica]SNS32590.1 hypothetical protein SAMN06265376_11152 [Dokdonia pacifica]
MKNSILKFALLLFAFILTIGCSSERDDTLEQELITANTFGIQPLQCANPDLDTEGYTVATVFVEFEPGLSRAEKQAIRAPYCGDIISIEPCTGRNLGEIWTMRGPCYTSGPLPINCQPGVVPPVDPDLRQAVIASECQPPNVDLILPD